MHAACKAGTYFTFSPGKSLAGGAANAGSHAVSFFSSFIEEFEQCSRKAPAQQAEKKTRHVYKRPFASCTMYVPQYRIQPVHVQIRSEQKLVGCHASAFSVY